LRERTAEGRRQFRERDLVQSQRQRPDVNLQRPAAAQVHGGEPALRQPKACALAALSRKTAAILIIDH
jgi:hypothetical protein